MDLPGRIRVLENRQANGLAENGLHGAGWKSL